MTAIAESELPRLVVIVPTYQERDNILSLVDALGGIFPALPYRCALLIADDDSPDGTGRMVRDAMAERPWLSLLSGKKEGLGIAYVRAIRHAIEVTGADVVVQMDADFSHRPSDLPRLLAALGEGADFVIGSRYVPGGSLPVEWGLRRHLISRWGNRVARFLVPGCAGVSDCTAGFRAIRAGLLKRIPLDRLGVRGYIFQPALLSEAVIAGGRIREVPVSFDDRLRGATKLGFSDIIEFARYCILRRFRR